MRYKDDPRQIVVRYPSYCAKCQTRLPKGTVVYYWPRTQTLLCDGCGESEYSSFLSAAADEDVYAGNGNPL
jgi:MinD superfamily P-loop ATPase